MFKYKEYEVDFGGITYIVAGEFMYADGMIETQALSVFGPGEDATTDILDDMNPVDAQEIIDRAVEYAYEDPTIRTS